MWQKTRAISSLITFEFNFSRWQICQLEICLVFFPMCVPFSFDFMDFNFRKLLENQSSNRFSYISIRAQLSFETIPLYNIFFSNLFLWLEFKLQQKKKKWITRVWSDTKITREKKKI